MAGTRNKKTTVAGIEKCPTGISGLDEITGGGLPRGRPTLVCGGAGSGKTLFSMEFLVRGVMEFNEPGVFMAFEESAEDLAKNVASLGFDVNDLIARKKMAIDYVHVDRQEIEEAGQYELEGLFVRLDSMIKHVGARRVAIDSLEALFAGLPNESILRSELRRLFRWLKDKGLTAVITAEQGANALTRHGLEEYVSDCVIFLDHRVCNQVATRRMRIVKYRGSSHGTNEYPTLIDESGLSILPISSLGLNYPVSKGRISSGIDRLDAMMGGKGYFRGSSILISGTAGLGKSSIAASFADRCCRDGLKCLYCSFEESPSQITRNMRSIGFNLDRWIKKGLLQLFAVRPTIYGLEMHLSSIHKLVQDYKPQAVVMDPITSMMPMGDFDEVRMMLTRAIDFLKGQNITTVFTSLTRGGDDLEQSEAGISSLMDTWLLLRAMDIGGERNRLIYILKSRGMAHSNQVREFQLTNKGIRLLNAYIGPGQVLTGSARVLQESKDRVQATIEQQAQEMRLRELLQQESVLQSQAQEIAQKLKNIGNELRIASRHRTAREMTVARENKELSRARYGD